MADDANTLLKGMLGIGGESNRTHSSGGDQRMKDGTLDSNNKSALKGRRCADGPVIQSSPSLPGKSRSPNETGGKSAKGNRGGSKKNSTDENDNRDGGAKASSKQKNQNIGRKKKSNNNKRNSQPDNDDEEVKKTIPHLKDSKHFNSDKQNANIYAWSAFQSSPDPSALPDIGGLFLGGGDRQSVDEESGDFLAKHGDCVSNMDVGSSVTFGPPSDIIRTSLVNSMLAKTTGSVNAGEALLKSLTSPNRQSCPPDTIHPAHKQFRTAESLEEELLSSPLKPDTEIEAIETIPILTLLHVPLPKDILPNEKSASVSEINDEPVSNDNEEGRGDVDQALKPDMLSPTEKQSISVEMKQYPDAISQLMNPGGFSDSGGYGMHPNGLPYPGHPSHHHHIPHQIPLHHGPPPQNYHHGHQGPYPPHPHFPPPYHHYQPFQQQQIPPGYTTVQVRVPGVLLPGNNMIVDGMQIPVPPGVPPGAIIPVNIPVFMARHNPQNYYTPPIHPQYHGGYDLNVPSRTGGHNSMMMHQPNGQPTPQSQRLIHTISEHQSSESSSWAARMKSGPSTQLETNEPNSLKDCLSSTNTDDNIS